jgi:hypothetical protein
MQTAVTKRSDNPRGGWAPAKATPGVGQELVSASPTAHSGVTESLHSWKEIAVYVHREVRTVQRWEKREGMPVHRHQHPKGSSIFAFKHEVDEWQRGRSHCRELCKPRELPTGKVLAARGPVNNDEEILYQLIKTVVAQLITQVVVSTVTDLERETGHGREKIPLVHQGKDLKETRGKFDGTSVESYSFLSRLQ